MRFGFAYDAVAGRLLRLMALGPRRSWIEVDGGHFQVRMGWAFKLDAPAASLAAAQEREAPIPLSLGIGVHGWHRNWAANAARRPHVEIRFAAPQLGFTLRLPIWVEVLHLAPADPAGLLATLHEWGAPARGVGPEGEGR